MRLGMRCMQAATESCSVPGLLCRAPDAAAPEEREVRVVRALLRNRKLAGAANSDSPSGLHGQTAASKLLTHFETAVAVHLKGALAQQPLLAGRGMLACSQVYASMSADR